MLLMKYMHYEINLYFHPPGCLQVRFGLAHLQGLKRSDILNMRAIKTLPCLLGGSWVAINGVISRVTIHIRGLITPLITTHEPPSEHSRVALLRVTIAVATGIVTEHLHQALGTLLRKQPCPGPEPKSYLNARP